jgi:hypothetical protein
MEVDMNHQAYVGTYRAAMEAATGELDGLFEEAKRLRNRMEQIDSAISALKILVGNDFEASSSADLAHEMSSDPVPMKQQIDSALGLVFA